MKKTFLTLTGMLLAFCAATGITAADRFRMKHLETGNGLSNNRINTILKDNDGFMWVGTTSGLFRYDGYDIRMFVDDPTSPSNIGNNNILDLQTDADGRIWVLAGSNYIVYDPAKETFINDIGTYLRAKGIQGEAATVFIDRNKALWVYVRKQGVYRLDNGSEKAEAVKGLKLSNRDITDIIEAGDKIVCVDNSGVLLFVDPATMTVVKTVDGIPASNPGDYTYTYTALADRDGSIWVFNTERLWLYDPGHDRWLTPMLPSEGRGMVVKTLYQGADGTLWIGRDHHGLERVVKQPDGIRFTEIDTGDTNPGANNTVTALMEDGSGTMWIGTYKRGLFYHNESAEKVSLYPLPDANVILNDPNNEEMWVGTDNSGLMKWNPVTGVNRSIPDPSDGKNPPAVTALAETPDGTLYIGTFARGLKKYAGGSFSRVSTASGLDSSYVWSIVPGDNNDLWVGTLGHGLYNHNLRTGETVSFTENNSNLPSDFVTSGLRTRDGKYYFSTASGVAVYDPATDRIAPLAVAGGGKDIENLNSTNINQIIEDSRGLLWIASTNGLKVLDRARGKIHEINLRDGMHSLFILGLIEDADKSIWVSEGGNLINLEVDFNEKNGELATTVHLYDSRDGVQNSDFNQRSFAMLDNGDIVAGGLYGINRFSPALISYNKTLPKVMFTGLAVMNRPVAVGDEINGRVVLPASLNSGHKIDLPPNADEFTVYFATDNYVLPDKTTYYYKLEGFNDDWIACPPRVNHVTYTNLSPGHYRLLVKAVNNDGYESAQPAELTVNIHPPFYATPLAYFFYVILASALIYGIVRIIRDRERNRFNRKRQEDNMRKQEEINQLKFKFFTNISHELRTPLTLIVSPLEAMIKESGGDEKQTRRLTMMRNNAMRLLNLVNQLLDFRKNEVAGLQLSPSEGDIVAFVRNTCNSFTTMSERKNIDLTFYSPEESINMMFDEDKMGKIIMNLLSNAFKFTPAGGRVDVAVERLPGPAPMVRIRVADTGIGIKDSDKERIFERFYQVDDNGEPHPGMGSGIGLSLVSEYVRLHNGTIRVTDNPGKGSVFIIDVPLRQPAKDEKKSGTQPVAPLNEATPEPVATGPDKTEEALPEITAPAPAPVAKTSPESKHPTALVVDDNADMLEFIKDGLTPEFHVITASDGAEALSVLKNIKPAIILTDLMMPNMDGIELCRRLKADSDTAAIPVIILTAKHDMQAKVEGLTIGADDYITKPFNIDLLQLRMRRLVQLTHKGVARTTIDPEPGDIKITPLDERLIEKAVKYVVANIKRPDLSVEELSSHLGMSRVNLYKKMKAVTGKTPIEFIRLIRLKRAAQMLRESQLNVSEIAYQLGFNSPKYFSKYFKEEFGILPSVYQLNESKGTNYTV